MRTPVPATTTVTARAGPFAAENGRVRRLVLSAFLIVVSISACSIVRLVYNHMDRLLLRELGAYLDLSTEQETQAAARLRRHLAAHRRTELPEYSRYLNRVQLMTAEGLDAGEADWIVEQGYTLARRTIRNLIPAITPSLTDLSERQIAHLESQLAKINRDYREEYLPESMEERRSRKTRRAVARIEHWTGKLRPDQVLLAGQLRNEFPDSAEDWLSYNIDRQHAFLNLLRGKPDANAVENSLVAWWVELKHRPPMLENMNQATLEGIKHMIVSVDATLDEDQRRHLRWRLDGYIDQVEVLRQQRE